MSTYDLLVRHFARAYTDALTVELSVDRQRELTKLLQEELKLHDLMHVTSLEMGPNMRLFRSSFYAPESGLKVLIRTESIDVELSGLDAPMPIQGDPPSQQAFSEMASKTINVILNFIGRVPHRLALVHEGLLAEMTPDRLNAVTRALLRLPEGKATPFEFLERVCYRGEVTWPGRSEVTNEISVSKRVQYKVARPNGPETQILDRIQLDFDINTTTDDTRQRFSESDIKAFFQAALPIHERMTTVSLHVVKEAE